MKTLGTMVGKITPLAPFGAEAIHADERQRNRRRSYCMVSGLQLCHHMRKCVYFGAL